MSVTRRLFVPPTAAHDGRAYALAEDEAHYARRVLRLGPGDTVELLDGTGRAAPAELAGTPQALSAVLTGPWHRTQAIGELPALTLAVAMPKGERADWLAEKLAELAVVRLQWLKCERSVVEPHERHLARTLRLMRAAVRQARHGRVPEQPAPQTFAEFVAESDGHSGRFVLDGAGIPAQTLRPPGSLRLIVGPEGGLTPEELQLAAAHSYSCASLGPATLRVETAAIVAAGLFGALGSPAQGQGRSECSD